MAGPGETQSGLPRILLPTDPRILSLTEEQIAWIEAMYKTDYPDHFRERYEDPEYLEWEKKTLVQIGAMTTDEYDEWHTTTQLEGEGFFKENEQCPM